MGVRFLNLDEDNLPVAFHHKVNLATRAAPPTRDHYVVMIQIQAHDLLFGGHTGKIGLLPP